MKNNKKISLLSGTAISVASMIGSGWLFSSQLAAQLAGNWAFVSWVLAGLVAITIGICLSIVVREYPVTGITTRSSSLSHNNIFGMPFAFANWFGIVVIVANEAQATGQYLFGYIKSNLFLLNGQVTYCGSLFELLIVIIYLLINFYGVKLLAQVNNVVTVFKIAVPAITIILFLTLHFDTRNFHLVTNNIYSVKSAITALVGAGLIYSLNGFQTVVSFAGEINNPKRNVPLAMFLAIVSVTIFYMLLELSFMGAVPHNNLVRGWEHVNFASPLFNLAIMLGLNFFALLLIASSIVCPSGTGYTYLGASSRMLYAMAKEGQVPMWLAKVVPEHGFSRRALIFNFILAASMLFIGDNWSVLMVIVTGCNIIGYMAAPISMGAIKPGTRIFGYFTFTLITLLLETVPVHDMLIINIVMTVVMVIYLLIQFESDSVEKIINFVLPFSIYLWAFCFVRNEIGLVLIGVVFYTLATNKKYVAYCIAHRKFEMHSSSWEPQVNINFDGGNIEVVDITNSNNMCFKIRSDTNSHFTQWFYFQLCNVKGHELLLSLINLKNTAYPDGWKNYNVVMSYDNVNWTRLQSNFDGEKLSFALTPSANKVYFAYFEPYSYGRHLELINSANQSLGVQHEILGKTHQGRNIDLLILGNQAATEKIWIIARQHPGETMAEWFMEGLIHKLLDAKDAVGKALLKETLFYLVPNMNPDGGYNGNLRVNSVGTNLNREWLNPTTQKSPEVFYVREKILATGVNMFFDIHGDEAIPYVFTSGCEDNPSFSQKQGRLSRQFEHYLKLVNPDYQTKFGYVRGQFSSETATLATNWVGNQFDCLAFTLEMPFKDNDNLPDIIHGWDGRRSYLFGQSFLIAINCFLAEQKQSLAEEISKCVELSGLDSCSTN